jgi:1-deoxy-D-xylulose-5-phosphate synthase
MPGGTGLLEFKKTYPKRLFDVGIAEEHAVSMAGGLAKQGMIPVVALYSTFLQRAYDMILQDVCMLHLHVVLAVDRAGLVGEDGETHHGIYDVAFLSEMPNIRQYAPMTYGSLRAILTDTKDAPYPVSIRYPNQPEREAVVKTFYPDGDYTTYGLKFDVAPGGQVILSYSGLILEALAAKALLAQEGSEVAVGLIEKLDPAFLVESLRQTLPGDAHIVFMEEGLYTGGLGMQLKARLADVRPDIRVDVLAIEAPHTSPSFDESHYQHHHISRSDCVACFQKV